MHHATSTIIQQWLTTPLMLGGSLDREGVPPLQDSLGLIGQRG
jgi:hypothetical protein